MTSQKLSLDCFCSKAGILKEASANVNEQEGLCHAANTVQTCTDVGPKRHLDGNSGDAFGSKLHEDTQVESRLILSPIRLQGSLSARSSGVQAPR